MPLDGHPTTLLGALLRRKGLAPRVSTTLTLTSLVPRPIVPPMERPELQAMVMEAARRVCVAVESARTERDFRAVLDSMLERKDALNLGSIARAALESTPEESLSALVDTRSRLGGLPEETRGVVLEAIGVQLQLLPTVSALAREVSANDLEAVTQAWEQDPVGYLTSFPVEVAELFLAGDRGVLAAMVVERLLEHPWETVQVWHLSLAARIWRDGARALARLFASVCPERVPEGLVPQSERIDIARLAEERKAEDAWLADLIAAHRDEDRFPIDARATRDGAS
jgi:hypothetical protein